MKHLLQDLYALIVPHSSISLTSLYLLVHPLLKLKNFNSLQSLKYSFPPNIPIRVQAHVTSHLENTHSLMTDASLIFPKPMCHICQTELPKVEIFTILLLCLKLFRAY